MPMKSPRIFSASSEKGVAIAGKATVSATAATLLSTAALALVSRAEGKGAIQPLNATSHWLHGDHAATYRRADVDHTAVGLGTHAAATFFWPWRSKRLW